MHRDRKNIIASGIPASPGIAIAKGFFLDRSLPSFVKSYVSREEVEIEVEKFLGAVDRSRIQLSEIQESLIEKNGEHYQILGVHISMLEDSMLIDATIKMIRDYFFRAEWALDKVLKDLVENFHRMEDPYLKQRGDDIKQIAHRIFENLAGRRVDSILEVGEDVVVIAHDLSPADTAQMVGRSVKGFATDMGSRTSHTAIVARSLRIPAVVGLGNVTSYFAYDEVYIIDGYEGIVIISPDESLISDYTKKLDRMERKRKALVKFSKLPSVTRDGRKLKVMANIEMPHEAEQALALGADGIGLYRTEFIYLNRRDMPLEDEQFMIYRGVVEKFQKGEVTIRTLDLGGDKFVSHVDLAEEMNPAMGLRAIRFCLKEKEIFKTQLRAILRASAYGNVRIMFPMVSCVWEIEEAKKVVSEAKRELSRDGHPFDEEVKIGIMVEVPSAAIISDILAGMVDFFSIGTNDLIQYCLAIDRVNESVTYLYDPLHPAIIRMIRFIVEAAHGAGIKAAMCGEMAGDHMFLPVLIGLELDELSMNPDSIPLAKTIIRKSDFGYAREFLEEIKSCASGRDISDMLRGKFEDLYPEEIVEKF
ncbi:MAG: phosphoenolpyruvate--protein phosphotransferase [Deltaproteobacteria bacterium]|nr:phosphoenolpyruvate--protein phosphotransferase [Deltaproteobacteria bacterium]NIS78559.1 phosphoenolpyruvate--protein phosphotransferase [Deltaproteobacteria bacterium]